MRSGENLPLRCKAFSHLFRFLSRTADLPAQKAGIEVHTGLRAKEVTDEGLVALDADGQDVLLPCDTVVLSMGVRPRKAAAEQFADTARDVFFCGDCAVNAGNITSAVRDAFYAAMNI